MKICVPKAVVMIMCGAFMLGGEYSSVSAQDRGHDQHAMADLGPADEEFDLRFLDAMILHHQGALIMSRDALQKGRHAELRQLAQTIIRAQEREITQMRQWRQAWYPRAGMEPIAYHASMGHGMPMSPELQESLLMRTDLGAGDAHYDLRFIRAMILHHEGAVVMAHDVLERSSRPEMQGLARDIIAAQQEEIARMRQWEKIWYQR